MRKGGMILGLLLVLALSFTVPPLSLASSEGLFKLKWKKEVGKSYQYNNPLIFGRYLLHALDKLYLFDQKGTLIWSFEGKDGTIGVVASPDFIVVSDWSGYVYALSWDGKTIWEFKTGRAVYFTSLGDLDGDGSLDVVVGSDDDYIYALSGRGGKLLWKFETVYDVWSSPALGDLDRDESLDVVVGSRDNYIYALSGRDGRLLWRFKTGWVVDSSPALGDLDRDGYLDVVVGSEDHYIYALSGRDGRLLWKFKTGRKIWSSPALGDLDGDGYLDLTVASMDGYLYVFEATVKGGEVVWSRFHGDSAGTGLYENAVSFAKFNLGGKALAWRPHYSLHELAKVAGFKYFSLQKVNYKPSSNLKINEVKRKKAIAAALKVARVELKQSLAERVKRMVNKTVEKLSQEAELTARKTIKAIYHRVLSEVFKGIDNLKPYQITELKRGEIQVLLVADWVVNRKRIEDRVGELVAKAIEGEKI